MAQIVESELEAGDDDDQTEELIESAKDFLEAQKKFIKKLNKVGVYLG